MNDTDLTCTLLERREEAESTLNTLVPKKSREAYDKEYITSEKLYKGYKPKKNLTFRKRNILIVSFEKQIITSRYFAIYNKC
jgi:hypothetical protein